MIKILDKSTADKIAAGEVIDRPAAIIKELLENSLDADSTAITVEIRNGGKSYIRITDNGHGIKAGEAELAFMRHATSKITSEKDLDSIHTLGFRGEALASICAVSRVELITKTSDAKTGRKVMIEGSAVLENSACGCPDGTTITVRDLFYNVPARHKFLSSDNSETRRIIDIVSRIALAYGDVRFSFISNGKNVFSTRGNGNIFNNIINIYGRDAGRDLLPVDAGRDGFMLRGFVSSPSASAPSRRKQIFCVNGRSIKSKVIERGLEEAYREKLFHGRYPVAFLFLTMPPERLDVNVHPTKKEVRFDNEAEVEDFITENVRSALTGKGALPRVRRENLKHQVQDEKNIYMFDNVLRDSHIFEDMAAEPPAGISCSQGSASSGAEPSGTEQMDIRKFLSDLRREKESSENIVYEEQELPLYSPEDKHFDFTSLDYIGTVFDTYIIGQDDDNVYMIDQHAAHERVFYEKLVNQYNDREKAGQQLMIPLNINVSANVAAMEDIWIRDLSNIGYDIEPFGDKRYIVRMIPAFMELSEAEAFLSDFFKGLEDRPDITDKRKLDKIIMRSCKSAVKGGDHLSDIEIKALIKELASCVNPFSCPHGRPVFIRMTRYEIEKMFKRIV